MEFKLYDDKNVNGDAPNQPEREIPTKPDKNPDPTRPRPGGNEPKKTDPTRIEEPKKNDPTRIGKAPQQKAGSHKWTKVNSWDEVLEKMQEVL